MDLASRFEAIALDDVRRFVTARVPEGLHLEFKTVADPALSPEARKELARILSGFANADGGIVVWGVDARKLDRVDCAQDLRPFGDVPLFVSRLDEVTPEAISPSLDGVQHKAILEDASRGFATTFIPKSDGGPHMALIGHQCYFRRSGNRFREMEHFEVEEMFGRRSRPKLSLSHRLGIRGHVPIKGGDLEKEVLIYLGVKNEGRGSAVAPYLAVQANEPFRVFQFGIDGNGNEGLRRLPGAEGRWARYGGDATTVVHPGIAYDVLALSGRFKMASETMNDQLVGWRLAAMDSPMTEGTLTVPARDLLALVHEKA